MSRALARAAKMQKVEGLSEEDQITRIKRRFDSLKEIKRPWIPEYEKVSKFVNNREQSFECISTPGDFCTGRVFDGCAGDASSALTSSMMAALYPTSDDSIRIMPSRWLSKKDAALPEVKEWYENASLEINSSWAAHGAGTRVALQEATNDLVNYGVGGWNWKRNEDVSMARELPVFVEVLNAKKAYIDENNHGVVDTIYVEREFTVRQFLQEYRKYKVHSDWYKAEKDGKLDDKVRVLQTLEPRSDGLHSDGSRNFEWATVHIDLTKNFKIKESGFHKMPGMVARWGKVSDETYGRSPAMRAIQDILEINIFREASIIATEKLLDPPLVVNEDGAVGNEEIDTSAGAINVRHASGRMESSRPAIEPINLVGELRSTYERINILTKQIENKFHSDDMVDLGSTDQRMTAAEASIRNQLRKQQLILVYSRLRDEMFYPAVCYTFDVLLNLGLLGYRKGSEELAEAQRVAKELGDDPPKIIPDPIQRLLDNGDAYRVGFTSEAERIAMMEILQGIKALLSSVMELGAIFPGAIDMVNVDYAIRKIQELSGAPSELLFSDMEVQKNRKAKQDGMAQQQALIQAQQKAELAKTGAQAVKEGTKGGLPAEMVLSQLAGPAA